MARLFRAFVVTATATCLAVPALARDHQAQAVQGNWQSGYPGAYQNSWQGQNPAQYPAPYPAAPYPGQYPAPPPGYGPAPQAAPDADPRYREMVEKCQGVTTRRSGTTGAVVGGLLGGVVGNRVASGNRTVGTIAGAAVGAVAGGAIGKSIDKNREQECEAFFSSYAPPQGYGPSPYPGVFPYGGPGYAPYGYPGYGYMMVPVPVITTQGCCNPCTETRTTTVTYVRERVRKVYRPVRIKRVKEKRVYTGS